MSRAQDPAERRRTAPRESATEREALIVLPSPGVALDAIRERPRAYDALVCASAIVLSLLLAFPLLDLDSGSLSVPFNYRGDALFYGMLIKGVIDHGWYLRNPDLGAPFGQQLYDFPHGADNLNFVLLRALTLVSSDPAVVWNLFFLLTIPLTALTAFVVLRRLAFGPAVAFTCAALFALAPYHFGRLWEGHLLLAAYYAVPLGAYLVLALYAGEPLFTRRSTERRVLRYASPRSLATLAICIVVASTGIYYALFTALLVLVATIATFVARRDSRDLAGGVTVLAVIGATLVVNLSPTLLYQREHGENPVVPSRSPVETDELSLHITHLVVPVRHHRIGFLADLAERYNARVSQPFISERISESLGTVATAGFLSLLVVAPAALVGRRRTNPLLVAAAAATVTGLLFSMTGGFQTLVSYYLNPLLRQGNRMSIFIAFFSLVAVAVFLEWLRRALAGRGAAPAVFATLAALLVAFGAYDQIGREYVPQHELNQAIYRSDGAFAREVERRLPTGASVFQLPHIRFPENPIGTIVSYDPVRGYLQSKDLRWSYGAMAGRPADWASEQAVDLPPRTLLAAVAAAGFDGLWIDRYGYPDRGRAFDARIRSLLGTSPISSVDGRLAFYNLRPFARRLRSRSSAPALAALREALLRPVRTESGPGMLELEQSGDPAVGAVQGFRRFAWRWLSAPRGRIDVVNPSNRPRMTTFQAFLQSGTTGSLQISYPDGTSQTVPLAPEGRYVKGTLLIRPGRNPIELAYRGEPVDDPTAVPPRRVYVRVMTRIADSVFDRFGGVAPLVGCTQPLPSTGCIAAG